MPITCRISAELTLRVTRAISDSAALRRAGMDQHLIAECGAVDERT
jgi:hypothetical protein